MELLLSPRSLKNWLSPSQDNNCTATDEKHQLARLSRQYRLETYEQLKTWDKKRASDLIKHRQKLQKHYDEWRQQREDAQHFREVVVQFLEQLIRQRVDSVVKQEGYVKMAQTDNPILLTINDKQQKQLQELKRYFWLFRQQTVSQLQRLNTMEQIENNKQLLAQANKEASQTCQQVSATFQTNREANRARDCPKDTYVTLLKLMTIAKRQYDLQIALEQLINDYEQIVRRQIVLERKATQSLLLSCREVMNLSQVSQTLQETTATPSTSQPTFSFEPFPSLHLFILHKSLADYCFQSEYRPVMIILTIDGFMHIANWQSEGYKPQFTFKLNSMVSCNPEGMHDLRVGCKQTSFLGMLGQKGKTLFQLYFRFKQTFERDQMMNSLRMLLP